jgi:hypothetical protein
MQMAILVHLLFCSARYIIQWERYNYSIRNGSFFQAELRGPVKKKKNLGIILIIMDREIAMTNTTP